MDVRLPYRWERMQPKLGGDLDAGLLGLITGLLAHAAQNGQRMLLDCHNFGSRIEGAIGSGAVPVSDLVDFYGKLAVALKGAAWGFDICNEPANLDPSVNWPALCQQVINAVRATDQTTNIIVEGSGWASAGGFTASNPTLHTLTDPAGKIIFSAHLYMDANNQGVAGDTGVTPTTGTDRAKDFVSWLDAQAHGQYRRVWLVSRPWPDGGVPSHRSVSESVRRFVLRLGCRPVVAGGLRV